MGSSKYKLSIAASMEAKNAAVLAKNVPINPNAAIVPRPLAI
ncbi:hypothetical protein GCM10008935_29950 [Alkalibacillus silvisoli]|uniref:Uncharacterized protein n=1 Tax=Alkalibacillus silvisoli TaxID=392823 RepID=A0ABP3K5E8_9BACI